MVNGCALVYCYSFPWCTLPEIRSAQPIRSIAGANASRYREGSGALVLAAQCNSRSSSTARRARGSAGFGRTRRGVGVLRVVQGCVGLLDRSGIWWGSFTCVSDRGDVKVRVALLTHRHHRRYCAVPACVCRFSPDAALPCHPPAPTYHAACSHLHTACSHIHTALQPPRTRPPHYGQSVGSQSERGAPLASEGFAPKSHALHA